LKKRDAIKLKDAIDERTTAAMLGITTRTLRRWHNCGYGPRLPGRRIRYSRAEAEAWVAKHGQGSHRPRSAKKPSSI
jgi:hypothetical protein